VAKFDRAARVPAMTGPIMTTGERTGTATGGAGWVRDVRSELLLLAAANMVGEDTFHESATDRDIRFGVLVAQAAGEDPNWTGRMIRWLRAEANMRSAAVAAAGAYVAAGGPGGRAVVSSALLRADEPAEMLAWWHQHLGRKVPKPVKRGVADAVTRLYTERAATKYDGLSRAWRMGDVIDQSHPRPCAPWQADLFRWLLDRRHDRPDPRITDRLTVLGRRAELEMMPINDRRAWLISDPTAPDVLRRTGMTWESLSGWLQGPMDRAAWEAVIPSMGYAALLRNLRNFDEAGVSDEAAERVADRLADPEQVAGSRQFPLRFLSAYKTAPSLRWAWPLEQAVQHSLANVPALPGRTLILVDLSPSMWNALSAQSQLRRCDAAALVGFALGLRAEQADVYSYGSFHGQVTLPAAGSLLPALEALTPIGNSTNTFATLHACCRGQRYDRVVIVTDEQAHDAGSYPLPKCPIITFNVGGYRAAHVQAAANQVTIGGLTDAGFRMVDLLDRRARGDWPF
jgi:hypothetical protein